MQDSVRAVRTRAQALRLHLVRLKQDKVYQLLVQISVA
jgi:hypothetical protein